MIGELKGWETRNRAIWIAGALGAVAFICIYGVKVLNPCYTDWLLSGGDLTQHYLGWKMYRNGAWTFPIGLTDQLAYPNYTSVIFTDSIPVFAVFFKLLSPLLPTDFQYFGLWGILCFILQGIIAAKLLQKFLSDNRIVVLGAMLFVLSPIFIWRMFAHTALAAHWLILLAFYPIVYYEVFHQTGKLAVFYGILGALCASTHLYFIPMSGIVLCGFLFIHFIKSSSKIKSFFPFLSFLTTAVITIYFLGGFSTEVASLQSSGLGIYSFNLNGFFNPQGWSTILKDLKTYVTVQYEGFAYLGLGVLFLFFVAILHSLGTCSFTFSSFHKINILDHIDKAAYIIIVILSVFAAVSPKISLGDRLLVSLAFPDFLEKIWSIFRATGRLIWPAVYSVMLFAICEGSIVLERYKFENSKISEKKDKKMSISVYVLLFCVLLQTIDLSNKFYSINKKFNTTMTYQSSLSSPLWEEILAEKEIQHFIFVKPTTNLLYSITELASKYHITISNFYFARPLKGELIQQNLQDARENPQEDSLHLFTQEGRFGALIFKGHLYFVDDLIIGHQQPLDISIAEITEEQKKEMACYRYLLEGNKYLKNGMDKDGVRYLDKGGLSYGPYLEIPEGRYQISIFGSQLQEASVWCQYDGGKSKIDILEVEKKDHLIEYQIVLEEDILDLEIMVHNNTDTQMRIEAFQIEMLDFEQKYKG